jgi:WD40 repeat protein
MLDADRHPKKILSTGLQVQFHGREIHSVHFISTVQLSLTSISWIATGAEDGTVRITRYDPKKIEQLDPSMVLGEHMGGSAVRALTLVLGAHEILGKHSSSVPQALGENPLLHNMHANSKQKSSMHLEDLKSTQVLDVMKTVDGEPLLLVSVGAKEVLTCWQLEWQQNSKFNVNSEEDFTLNRRHHFEQSSKSLPLLNHLPTDVPSSEPTLIAKWLSSYTPSHACNPSLQHMATEMQSGRAGCTANLTYVEKRSQEERKKERMERKVLKKGIGDEDDLRFLAVTAFSTRVSGTESVTCFMVTASSNATLRLHAFNVTSKSWLEVAVLEYHAVPVLALQHLVVPLQSPHITDWCSKAYLIISGATDGTIAIWDITDSVVTFSRQAISSSMLNLGTVQTPLRPKKGRGSQGGRRWQNSRHSLKPRNVQTDKDMFDGVLMVTSQDIKTSKIHNCNEEASDLQKSVCVEGEPICSVVDEGNTTESMETHKASVLQPIHIFARVHQSGVNCLSISRVVAGEGLVFALASGGDDQALHVRKFRVIGDSKDVFAQGGAKQLCLEVEHLSQESIHCAHNSALKGVHLLS